MDMQWTDLEVGDILCFNPEFLTRFRAERPEYNSFMPDVLASAPEFFVVREIVLEDQYMYLRFDFWHDLFSIAKESGKFHSFPDGPPVFKIAGLKEQQSET